jgi:ribonuclease P protein component
MQRQFHLRRSADFARLRAEGRAWHHPFVVMSVARNTLEHNRFGFIVSRHLGGAVVRNRIRRRLREIVRLAAPRLKPGFDVVFIARNNIAAQPYIKIQEALDDLFKRANLWQ